MTSLNISLPESMRTFVERQVATGDYCTASEYLRQLIREAQKRQAQAELEAKLLDGLASGEAAEMTAKDWEDVRRRVHERVARRKSS